MANKRTLKKEINYVAGELLSECLCNKYLIPGTDAEKIIRSVLSVWLPIPVIGTFS